MRTELKAAIAGTVGVTLLLGGAGTLAYWTDAETVTGGSVSSGELQLTTPTCDPTWSLNGGIFYPQAVSDDPLTVGVDETHAASLIVPGDTLTKSCSYTIEAAGDNLQADLSVTNPTETGTLNGLNDELTVGGAYTVGGASVATITEADHGKTLQATITVQFPFGTVADNDSQNLTATISGYTVTATQTDATP